MANKKEPADKGSEVKLTAEMEEELTNGRDKEGEDDAQQSD